MPSNVSAEEPGQTVLIALHSAEGDRIVSFVRPHDDVPIITMKGPKQAVDDAKKQLAGEKGIITIDVPSELTPGVRNVTIDLPIKEASIFRKNGIEVTDVSPRTIEVRIEPLRTYELEVAAPPGTNLDGSASFEPKTVKIRAPQDVFNDAATKNGGKLMAFAQILAGSDLAKPGSHNDVKLPIQLPIQGDNVALLSGSDRTSDLRHQAELHPDGHPIACGSHVIRRKHRQRFGRRLVTTNGEHHDCRSAREVR